MVTVYIGDLNSNDDFRLVTDSQDVASLKSDYPTIPGLKKYDSFFVLDRWDIFEIWGFFGNIPYTYKLTYLIYQERKNPMAYNRLSNYATTISAFQGYTNVIYHSTNIVRWNNNQVVLNTGGYNTVTTKRKMNQAAEQFNLKYKIFQDDFTWYIVGDFKYSYNDGITWIKSNNIPVLFQDGMILER